MARVGARRLTAAVLVAALGIAALAAAPATSAPVVDAVAAGSPAPAPSPAGPVDRVSGPDRFATSVAISQAFYDPGVPVVFIASGLNFPDALSGAPVAGRLGGPLLLTLPGSLPQAVATELDRLRPARIVVLGGTGSISTTVATALAQHTSDRTAPQAVTAVAATVTQTAATLSWQLPVDADLAGVLLRRAEGATAPTTPSDGTAVVDTDATATTFVDSGLVPGATYSYALFAHDATPNYASAAAVTVTTEALAPPGAVSGTVVEAGGLGGDLAGVVVTASSESTGDTETTTTSPDGSYEIRDLTAADDYLVCFDGASATGGSTDLTGYLSQCFDAASQVDATPVQVSAGSTRTGVDAALPAGGAITGTVTDVLGNGLSGVTVTASGHRVTTDTEGSYRIGGIPAGSVRVCVQGSDAVGGAYDLLGYVERCFQGRGENETWDPVPVSVGTVTGAIDFALPANGGFSGLVTDDRGRPLAGVLVSVGRCVSPDETVTTAADGRYLFTGGRPNAGCSVAFDGFTAAGGWSDALGYSRIPNPQGDPMMTPGTIVPGIDAELEALGGVAGMVTDGSGQPLQGVRVGLYPYDTTTDATGHYLLRTGASTAGLICLDTTKAAGGQYDTWGYQDDCAWSDAVRAGAITLADDIALVSLGGLAGTVTDDRGNPLAGVSVSAISYSTGTGSTFTDSAGRYTIDGLGPAADYQVCFRGDANGRRASGGWSDDIGYVHTCADQASWPVGVVVEQHTATTIDAALEAAGTLTGLVTDSTGAPLARVVIVATSESTGVARQVTTSTDGRYTIKGLAAAADYEVCFGASEARGGRADGLGYLDACHDPGPDGSAGAVTIEPGKVTSGVDAALSAAAGVVGVVSDAIGNPLRGVRVNLVMDGSRGEDTTDSEGRFRVTALDPGGVAELCFLGSTGSGGVDDDHAYADRCVETGPPGSPAGLRSGEVTTVDVGLVARGHLEGSVTDSGGHPLAGVRVRLASADLRSEVTTAADGSYRFRSLNPGSDYTVCFQSWLATGGEADGLGYVDECYQDRPIAGGPAPTPIMVESRLTTRIDSQLSTLGGVRVMVRDELGHPLWNARVSLRSTTTGLDTSRTTDANGVLLITRVPPATDYTLCITSASDTAGGTNGDLGYVRQCFDGLPTYATPTPLAVAGGMLREVEFVLAAAGGISGTVTDASGRPLARVHAEITSDLEGYLGYALTSSSGSYAVRDLDPSATYQVCFDASEISPDGGGAYARECFDDQPSDGSPVRVPVTPGSTTNGIDAVLSPM